MMSLSVVRRRKAVWAILVALAFLAVSLPKTNQAQTRDPLTGRIVQENPQIDNDTTPQAIGRPNVTVLGKIDGDVVPVFAVFPTDIPPILDPITGDPVGTPRQTQIIAFIEALADVTDLYRFQLARETNISINLAFDSGAYQVVSKDAVVLGFGLPINFPDVVVPEDLDLFLLKSNGDFIDSSETGLGTVFTTLPFFNPAFEVETVSITKLPAGQYIADVENFNSFSIFLLTAAPDQNVLTNELVFAWESAVAAPYKLRIGVAPITNEGQPPEIVQPPQGGVKFAGSYRPTRPVSGAAQDYQILDVTKPGRYTMNVAVKPTGNNNGGHMTLMRYDNATGRGTVVARSVAVSNTLESLANVTLEPGRYVMAMQQDGLKPLTKRRNYFISVLNNAGEMVALQSGRPFDLNSLHDGIQRFVGNTTALDDDTKPGDNGGSGGGNK